MGLSSSISFSTSQFDPSAIQSAPSRQVDPSSGGSSSFDSHLDSAGSTDDSPAARAANRRNDPGQRAQSQSGSSDTQDGSTSDTATTAVATATPAAAPTVTLVETPANPADDAKASTATADASKAAKPAATAQPDAPTPPVANATQPDPTDLAATTAAKPADAKASATDQTDKKPEDSKAADALLPQAVVVPVAVPLQTNVKTHASRSDSAKAAPATTPVLPAAAPTPQPETPAPLAATGANGTAGTDTAQTDNAAANPDGDLAIKATKDGLGHQAAANMAEKSAANATNAAQTVNTAAAATAQAAATPASAATFASKIAQASGEGVVTGVSASSAGTAGSSLTAQLSDLQNAGAGQTQAANTATATVRIGTLPGQTQPTQIPAMAIALQIAKNLQNGVNSFDIRLDPAEMGRIDIRMAVQRDGTVAAHVTADQKTTLDLLQRDSQSLQQALTDAGLQANSDSLSFSLRDQNSGGNAQNLASGNSDAAPAAAQAAGDATTASPIYNVNLSATGGVDIRV